jgi:imidazolonepropionase-like amidohydrolase
VIAHVPGYNIPAGDPVERFRIAPEDARRAAERGTVVIVTTLLSQGFSRDNAERLAIMRENHARNLQVLSDAGVTMALGSDAYSDTSVDEALNVGSLAVLEPVEILRSLSMVTPRAIFPDRRIGELAEGAEADLLVLTADPLVDLSNLRAIGLRMKAGRLLSTPIP